MTKRYVHFGKDIDLNGLYRITMTDYCYRNYQSYLEDAIIHHTSESTMSTLIAKNLSDMLYSIELKNNFKVIK